MTRAKRTKTEKEKELKEKGPESALDTAYPKPEVYDEDVICFADMHGHSRKKNVFVYGPQFLLSDDRYYRCRLIPKLLSEAT